MRKFMTHETREAIYEVARKRSEDRVIEISNQLYESLKEDIIDAGTYGGEYLTATEERRIGKTCALIKLASEYEIPIIVQSSNIKRCVEAQAKDLNKSIQVIIVNRHEDARSYQKKKYRIVLQEEKVDTRLIHEYFRPLGIVGFQ